MFFFLSKTLDLAFSPLSWAMGLLLVALVTWTKRARLARATTLLALGVLLLFSLESVANALLRSIEMPSARTFHEDTVYDAVLLLGGLVEERPTEEHNQPAYSESAERLLVTYDLLRAGRARTAIISGGPVQGTQVIEAHVLATQLMAWGIEHHRVVVEATALNTHDNAVEMARLAREQGWQRMVVVTSAFHMPRALGCFRAVGLTVDALPVDYRSFDPSRYAPHWHPRRAYLAQSTLALRELAGQVIYRLRGYAR